MHKVLLAMVDKRCNKPAVWSSSAATCAVLFQGKHHGGMRKLTYKLLQQQLLMCTHTCTGRLHAAAQLPWPWTSDTGSAVLACSFLTSGDPDPRVVMRIVPSGIGALSEYTQGEPAAAACNSRKPAKKATSMTSAPIHDNLINRLRLLTIWCR
jgi:hypothetical protein